MTADIAILRRKSLVARPPLASFLVMAHAIFWICWSPILFLAAPPRPFSALGAILGLALPAFLVTGATHGRAGVRDLLRRTMRWRVGIGWCLFAVFAIPVGAMLLAPLLLGMAPLQAFAREWSLLVTVFLPHLVLALVTVQLFEEVAWSGLVQHTLQSRYATWKATTLVGVAFATIHLPTYLTLPITARQLLQVLIAQVVLIIPFAILFRALIAWTYKPNWLQHPAGRRRSRILQHRRRDRQPGGRGDVGGADPRSGRHRAASSHRGGVEQRHAGDRRGHPTTTMPTPSRQPQITDLQDQEVRLGNDDQARSVKKQSIEPRQSATYGLSDNYQAAMCSFGRMSFQRFTLRSSPFLIPNSVYVKVATAVRLSIVVSCGPALAAQSIPTSKLRPDSARHHDQAALRPFRPADLVVESNDLGAGPQVPRSRPPGVLGVGDEEIVTGPNRSPIPRAG